MQAKDFGLLLFFTVCAVISLTASRTFAQVQPESANVKVSNSEFDLLLGKWSGVMTSFEYGNDSTQMRTDVDWNVTESDSGLVTTITYWDEGGEAIDVVGLITTSAGGKRITMDGKGWIVWAKRETENGRTIVFQGPGQDNNRNAQITHVLYMSFPDSSRQDSVVLTKKVLYENAGHEIERSQFRLGRVKE